MPTGKLTQPDLLRAWRDAVDPEFARGVLEGGEGAEVPGQMAEQLALVSAAAEETAEELWLLPYSGQSGAPAGGAARSTVALSLARTKAFGEVLVLEPGQLFEEVQLDAGPQGAVEVRTGRRYGLDARLIFFGGDAAFADVPATAEKAGRAFDLPRPGSVTLPVAPGAGLGNDSASVEPSTVGPHRLRSAPKPDTFIPEHVGRTVELTAGANAGQLRRVIGYEPPQPGDAGSLLLARDALVRTASIGLSLIPGEELLVAATGARARFLGSGVNLTGAHFALVEELNAIPLAPFDTAVGQESSSSLTVATVESSSAMAAESDTASWRIVDPAERYGLASSNAASPAGGRDATLDSLAWARSAQRAPGEEDDQLRERLADPLRAVSPAAVLRAVNRALAPFGQEAALLEAGTPPMPGFFCDADFFDLDSVAVTGAVVGSFISGEPVVQTLSGARGTAICNAPLSTTLVSPEVLVGVGRVRGAFVNAREIRGLVSGATVPNPVVSGGLRREDRLRTVDTYLESRAFFLLGLAHRDVGDFGFFLDAGPYGFFDSSPAPSFFDGFPSTSAVVARRAWQAADEARAAGVGHDVLLVDSA